MALSIDSGQRELTALCKAAIGVAKITRTVAVKMYTKGVATEPWGQEKLRRWWMLWWRHAMGLELLDGMTLTTTGEEDAKRPGGIVQSGLYDFWHVGKEAAFMG
jgi:hypothetical protein